jgi:hypothetical protein
MARHWLLRSSQSGGDCAIYPWSIKFARARVFAAPRCGGDRTGCDLGPAAVLPTPTALVDIRFAVWTAGLMGDAIILIKRHLGNRAAKSRGTGRYRAGRHFAATDRGEPARSGFCAAARGIFGHFSDSRAEQCIFPLLALSRLLSWCSRRWQSSTKHGGREASAQSIALSDFWSRGSVVVVSGSAVLDHATVIMRPSMRKFAPLEVEHT